MLEELGKVRIGLGEKLVIFQDSDTLLCHLKLRRGSQERTTGLPFSPHLNEVIKNVKKVTRDVDKTILLIAQWLDNPKTVRKKVCGER